MKVYIICTGEYSDRHICYVTLDKDKAEELCKIAEYTDRYGNAWIDAYDTDNSDEVAERGIEYMYTVTFTHSSYTIEKVDHDTDEGIESFKDGSVVVTVSAKNEDEALKIAADRRAKYIAEKEGLT